MTQVARVHVSMSDTGATLDPHITTTDSKSNYYTEPVLSLVVLPVWSAQLKHA